MGAGAFSSTPRGESQYDKDLAEERKVNAALEIFMAIINTPLDKLLATIFLDNHETPAAYNELERRIVRASLSVEQQAIIKKTVADATANAMKLILLGDLHQYGIGFTRSNSKALEYYQQAAALTDSTQACGAAHRQLARFYRLNANLLSPSYSRKARHHYEMAMHYNNANAYAEYGRCWETGAIGLKPDLDKAIEYYLKAAQLNNPHAFNYLAIVYIKRMEAREKEADENRDEGEIEAAKKMKAEATEAAEKMYQYSLQAVAVGSDHAVANLAEFFQNKQSKIQDETVNHVLKIDCYEKAFYAKISNTLEPLLATNAGLVWGRSSLGRLSHNLRDLITYLKQHPDQASQSIPLIMKERGHYFKMRYHLAFILQDTAELKALLNKDFSKWINLFEEYYLPQINHTPDIVPVKHLGNAPEIIPMLEQVFSGEWQKNAFKTGTLVEHHQKRVAFGLLLDKYAMMCCKDFNHTASLVRAAYHIMRGVDIKNLTPTQQCELGHFYYAHQQLLPLAPISSRRTALAYFTSFLLTPQAHDIAPLEIERAKKLCEDISADFLPALPPLPPLPLQQKKEFFSPFSDLLHAWKRSSTDSNAPLRKTPPTLPVTPSTSRSVCGR